MMGILYTEQSCRSCIFCDFIQDSFHPDYGKLCRGAPFYGVYGALFNILSIHVSVALFFVGDG
jgi:hypothetical protein